METANVNATPAHPSVIVVTMDSFKHSTRARKAALTYAEASFATQFLGMSAAGRTKRWEPAGRYTYEGVDVQLVPMRTPATSPSRRSVLRNVCLTYVPALIRMSRTLWKTQADVVHVGSTPLIPLGALHRLRHRSRILLDVTERPGAVGTKGSAFAVFARVETLVMAVFGRVVSVALAVVPGDLPALMQMGFREVHLVRNAPRAQWRAPYIDPPSGPLRVILVGSIFEGRGFELLLDAVSQVDADKDLEVRVFGTGRDEYIQDLKNQSVARGVDDRVHWMGAIPPESVSSTYLSGHVGLVLYEPNVSGNDGLSNKILECVSSGRPVLAADLPENSAFVTKHAVGWLTDLTTEDLASHLADLAMQTSGFESVSARCRALGDLELTWDSEFSPVLEWARLRIRPPMAGPVREQH